MSTNNLSEYNVFQGEFTRKTDNNIYKDIMLSFTDSSLKNICSIISDRLSKNNQDITINELFIKYSDYNSFMENQTYEKKNGNTVCVTSHIERPNFSCKLVTVKSNSPEQTLIISNIQLRLDSVKPINIDDMVEFENVSATILGDCYLNGGNQ